MKIALSIPEYGNISNSGLPVGIPTGGFGGSGAGLKIIQVLLACLVLGAILFTIYQLLTGGISIMMSKGNKERYVKGRDKIFHALIGLIAVFLSFTLILIFERILNIPLLFFYDWTLSVPPL
jgi:hypothetical protein